MGEGEGPNKNWYVLGVDLEELMGSLKYSTSAQLVLSLSRFPLAFENKLALPILHALDGGSGRRSVGGIGFPSPFSFLVFGWVGCSLLWMAAASFSSFPSHPLFGSGARSPVDLTVDTTYGLTCP